MAYKRQSPEPIVEGGTGIQSAAIYAPLCGNSISGLQSASIGQSNVGYILTSNGSALPSWKPAATLPSTTLTYTPTMTFGGSSAASYLQRQGFYSVVGNIVFFFIYIQITTKSGATGTMAVTLPPIASSGTVGICFGNSNSGITFNSGQTGIVGTIGTTTVGVIGVGSGASPTAFTDANWGGTGSAIAWQGFYFTA